MSILNPVQKTLPTDVWQEDKKIKPEIKKAIIDGLYEFLDPINIKEIFVIGTITGYQWTKTSDIDCNVVVDPPELVTDLILKQQRKANGGDLAPNTTHPINYFLVPWKGEATFWGDNIFGVYDLLNDVWVCLPGKPEDIRDPALEFGMEINFAKLYINKFERLVQRWKDDLEYLQEVQNNYSDGFVRQAEIKSTTLKLKRDFDDLLNFCHEIGRDRKLEYQLGWGVPRKNWRNIVFKIIEETELKHYFEFFEELKVDDYYTTFYKIIHEPIKDKEPIVGYRINRNRHPLLPDVTKP